MENKEYIFEGNSFQFVINNLLLKKKSNKLLLKYAQLEEEYMWDIDTSIFDNYEPRIKELQSALANNTDKSQVKDLQVKLDASVMAYNADLKVKALKKRLQIVQGLILKDIIEDTTFISNLFENILQGDHSKLDYDSENMPEFIMGVITDFFIFTVKSSSLLKKR